MVDFYGKLVGNYTSPMDPMGMYRVASKKAATTSVAAQKWNLQVDAGDFGGIHRGFLARIAHVTRWDRKATPWKINMEPENTPPEKENHLPNHHFQVLC